MEAKLPEGALPAGRRPLPGCCGKPKEAVEAYARCASRRGKDDAARRQGRRHRPPEREPRRPGRAAAPPARKNEIRGAVPVDIDWAKRNLALLLAGGTSSSDSRRRWDSSGWPSTTRARCRTTCPPRQHGVAPDPGPRPGGPEPEAVPRPRDQDPRRAVAGEGHVAGRRVRPRHALRRGGPSGQVAGEVEAALRTRRLGRPATCRSTR